MRTRRTLGILSAAVAATVMACAARADVRQAQDYIFGNGTPGPYPLAWKHILAGSEHITLNDTPLLWGVDYSLDPDAGTLTFTHPLSAQSGAVVQYGYDTKAAQAQGGTTLPLALALNGNLSLTGGYNHATANGNSPGALNMGLNGGWQGANDSKLTTHLLFVPAMTGADAATAANGMARLGFAASGQTRLGKPLEVSFGFSRAGQGVGSLGSDNWQAGQQKMTLNAAFNPSKQVQATLGYQQADPASGQGTAQSQLNAALALTPSDKIQLKTSLAQTTGGGKDAVQTMAASAVLKPSGKAELDADFTQKDSTDKTAAAQTLNLKAALKPTDKSELDATFAQNDAPGANGPTQNVDVKAAVSAGKSLALTAEAGQNDAGTAGATQTVKATMTAKPADRAELDASFSSQDAPGTANDAQDMNLKAALGAGKPVSLTASLDQSSQGTQDSNAQTVRLSLTPRPTLQVNTGLSLRQTSAATSQAATVDGKVQPWAFLLLSGGYQWRTVTPTQTGATVAGNYDSSTAQVTLAPKAPLHLIGTYAQNPDDPSGNPQRLAKRGVDLQATVGGLSLTGGYAWTCQYDTPSTGTSVHVGLGLRVSAQTQLTGDYKQDLTGLGLAPAGTNAYTLGLTRNLGDAFNLSLNAAMTQTVGQNSTTPTDVTASANLGMKF